MKKNAIILDKRTIAEFVGTIIGIPFILFVLFYYGFTGIKELWVREFQNSIQLIVFLLVELGFLGCLAYIFIKTFLNYMRKYSLSEDGISIYGLIGKPKVYSWESLYCVDVAHISVDKQYVPFIRCFWSKPRKDWDSKVRYLDAYLITNDHICVLSYTSERLEEFEKYTVVEHKNNSK